MYYLFEFLIILALRKSTHELKQSRLSSILSTSMTVNSTSYRIGDLYMANGTVKWFNPTKGFGFIQPDQGGEDVFVHISTVERAGLRDLNDGQKVSYDLEDNRGRTAAANLQLVDAA